MIRMFSTYLGHSSGESYPSAEMQSVYWAASANLATDELDIINIVSITQLILSLSLPSSFSLSLSLSLSLFLSFSER